MRLAAAMMLCEGELPLATESVLAMLRACAGHEVDFYFTDDASPSHVGDALVELCQRNGAGATCLRLDRPAGNKGGIQRIIMLLDAITASGQTYNYAVKFDPDTVCFRTGLAESIAAALPDEIGIAGQLYTLRLRDRVLLAADFLPMGFTRAVIDGRPVRQWLLRRWWPVWWWREGWRALWHGYRGHFIAGGFYAIGRQTLEAFVARRALAHHKLGRHGFFVAEEDWASTLLTWSMGHPIVDLNRIHPNWGDMRINHTLSAEQVIATGGYIAHPLKARPDHQPLRAGLLRAMGVVPETAPPEPQRAATFAHQGAMPTSAPLTPLRTTGAPTRSSTQKTPDP